MRKLENNELITEYHDDLDEDISFEETKTAITSAFNFIKDNMASEDLPTIRWKYFGTFVVYNGRANSILDRTKRHFDKGSITEKLYNQRTGMLNEFLNKRNEN